MLDILLQLGLFTAKSLVIFFIIIITVAAVLAIITKSKEKLRERLVITNLNEKYDDNRDMLIADTFTKKSYKSYLKDQKKKSKKAKKTDKKKAYVLNFNGDIKASAVSNLREEITALLGVATPKDEVILRLESPGGMVHAYGLAAAQLIRLKEKKIPLTVTIDKVAASGGYMMACIADKIIAAPFSIIGSIGVIVQFPNFNRFMKDKHIDFEQHTAGKFKRTLTMFGENTEEGREKLQEEIEIIHKLFKELIHDHRPQLNMDEVATGEHWLGKQAIDLKLVDHLQTSDDYLLDRAKEANLYEINYEMKKPFTSKLLAGASTLKEQLFSRF